MRKKINLPTDTAFFNRYAVLIPTIDLSSNIAQLISALTEIGVIFSILYIKLSDFLPVWVAFIFAIIGAILGTVFLEIGLKKFIPFSIRAVLFKRFRGLDLVVTVFVFLTAFILVLSSGFLSFNGSKEIIANLSSAPPQISTDSIEERRADRIRATAANYSADSTSTAARFNSQIHATGAKFESQISKGWNEYSRLKKREGIEGKSYRTSKDNVSARIAALKAEKATEIAELKRQKGNELAALQVAKNADIQGIEGNYIADVNAIKSDNKKARDKATAKTENYGIGLGAFTIVCLLLFILLCVIKEVILKGSGVESTAAPTQYFFSQSAMGEAWEAITERVQHDIRKRIADFAAKTPPPIAPTAAPILYNTATLPQQRIDFEFEETDNLPKVKLPTIADDVVRQLESRQDLKIEAANYQNLPSSELENKALGYLRAAENLRECNLIDEAAKMELTAEQVLKCYLGKEATAANIQDLKNRIVGFLNGQNDNPFQQHHRLRIKGFQSNKNDDTPTIQTPSDDTTIQPPYDNRITDNLPTNKRRVCEHCQQPYDYRHHKQKYCSENCRKKAWEQRTGRKLKLKKRK